jgi:hypothetical protein
MTVVAPPATRPKLDSDEWTITPAPADRPTARNPATMSAFWTLRITPS